MHTKTISCFPSYNQIKNKKHIFDFTKGEFVFRDFVVTLSKAQKDAWRINIKEAKDSWENIGFGWFTLEDLPHPLHNGVRFIFQHLGVDQDI